MTELTPEEAATVERFERAPDALVEDLRDEVAVMIHDAIDSDLSADPTRAELQAACDRAADALLPLIAQREAAARAEERERVARAIEAERPEMGSHILISHYRQGRDDAFYRATRIARGDA